MRVLKEAEAATQLAAYDDKIRRTVEDILNFPQPISPPSRGATLVALSFVTRTRKWFELLMRWHQSTCR